MTERALSISTQLATPIPPSYTPSLSTHDVVPVPESVDEEPYTIKCICDYSDDDGNTIYCETCDTWQHIECFYPGRVEDASREDFDHSCADCKPRPLDGRHAIERQRHRQNKSANDNGDKKNKRLPSKSHKKKTKPAELQVNGFHDHDGHKHLSAQDQHSHTKKAKGHRSHQSVSSQATKRSPPHSARGHNHAPPPSPIQTPPDFLNNFQVHSYSDNFLSLYTDHPFVHTDTNSFANLEVTNRLSTWVHDPHQLEKDVGIRHQEDAFSILKTTPDETQWPKLRLEHKFNTIDDIKVEWRYLTILSHRGIETPIGELTGHVGFQKDYCADIDNRWQEMVHPRPLIFFHPRLPIFIDARKEGNVCRYIRRSCRPNAYLDAFITNQSEWHFWLISERAISANEQITIPWEFRFPLDLRERFSQFLLHSGDEAKSPEFSDEEYEQLMSTIHLVLSDYGGCACDQGSDCSFARFQRNYHGRLHSHAQTNGTNGVKSKKGRKPKHHVSPTSTGHATNSRAASEGHAEPYDEDDARSVSGSVRSKPQSRDLTPLHSVGEANGILTEPSDREKRKLAMLEDSFRKMEQGQPPRKKKRASDGSNVNSPISNTAGPQSHTKPRQKSVVSRTSVSQQSIANGGTSRPRQYVDASTSRRLSGSPSSAASPRTIASPRPFVTRDNFADQRSRENSVFVKPTYADSSTQTDRDEDAWYEPKHKPTPKKPILSLSKRLFKNRQKVHQQIEAHHRAQLEAERSNGDTQAPFSPTTAMDIDGPAQEDRSTTESPTNSKARTASIASSTLSVDMASIAGEMHPPDGPLLVMGQTMKPPSWTGNTNIGVTRKSPDLRVQMPPASSFPISNPSATTGATTPLAANSTAMSPFGTPQFAVYTASLSNGVAPSPAKKKMSLNDYKALKQKNADGSGGRKASVGGSPTMPSAVLKPSLSTIEEAKAHGALGGGSAVIDSPSIEKVYEPMSSVSLSDPPPRTHLPSEQMNGIL
ncbi:PHD-finger domain-containing protein [Rutstroemia sp. NJR-2017a WRK4]|nr:PHD-finger domain-containing protein [Rutstroemia sp. NJR-2017a WRK4]